MSKIDVYIVLYYCGDKMFNIVKVFNTLENAYIYICEQESNMYYQESKTYKMLSIDSQLSIDEYSNSVDTELGICYIKKGYMNLNLDKNKISEYIIISKSIE